jgi:pimeloyl-ACP methyl ester carboxylesterase
VRAATWRRALECLPTFARRANGPAIGGRAWLLAGEHDRDAPPALMKKIATAIPHSSQQVMKGVGHLQNLEAPDDFDGLLLDFLALPAPLLH